jgi:hypothetical protein
MPNDSSCARPGADDAGTENAQNLGSGLILIQPEGECKAAPKLTFKLNQGGPNRLWVMIEGLPYRYAAEIHELDQPAYLVARIKFDTEFFVSCEEFSRQYVPTLEKLLIGPHHTFAQWERLVDEALAAIGVEACQ